MLLQSLVLIATMLVVTAALMMNGLFSARAALHQRVLLASKTEMADASSDFIRWARSEVQQSGADPRRWPTMKPKFVPVCDQSAGTIKMCNLYAQIAWTVSGSTLDDPAGATSMANNLSETVGEQRISVTISEKITNSRKLADYGEAARLITIRLFNASPFAIATASKDVSSAIGIIGSSEGDSAGTTVKNQQSFYYAKAPEPSRPAAFIYTIINVVVNCLNPPNSSNSLMSSSGARQLIGIRKTGNLAYAFLTPCSPNFTMRNIAPGFNLSKNNEYQEDSVTDSSWQKHDQPASTFSN